MRSASDGSGDPYPRSPPPTIEHKRTTSRAGSSHYACGTLAPRHSRNGQRHLRCTRAGTTFRHRTMPQEAHLPANWSRYYGQARAQTHAQIGLPSTRRQRFSRKGVVHTQARAEEQAAEANVVPTDLERFLASAHGRTTDGAIVAITGDDMRKR